jgi:hypothetical protein
MRAMHPRIAAAAALSIAAAASSARAQAGAPAMAEALFDEGISLMKIGAYDRACPKLEESQRLDPGGGTLLNLARCYEGQGRLATAWTRLHEALRVARREGRADRVDYAEKEIARLGERVPRVVVRVAERAEGLEVFVDDVKIGGAAWDAAQPVDPGAHIVRASAPGRRAFAVDVTVPERETRNVAIPPLARASSAPEGSLAPAPPDGAAQRTIGWTTGGFGAAALVAGGVLGLLALEANSTADTLCPGIAPCGDSRGIDASSRAHSFGTAATISLVGGAALVVTGIVLLATAPRAPR